MYCAKWLWSMKRKLVFNKEYLKLYCLADFPVLYAEWQMMTSFENMKEGSMAYLDALKKYELSHVLVDLTKIKGNFSYLTDWIREDWAPLAHAAGLKAVAMIPSSDIFTQYTIEQINRRYQKGDKLFKFRMYLQAEDAYDWILQEQAQNAK